MTRITGLLVVLSLLVFQVPAAASPLAHLWSKGFGGLGQEFAYAVATDNTGNVYMTGTFNSSISFGGPALTPVGGFDVFLAKFSATGQHLWSVRLGGTWDEDALALTTDAAGYVYLAGTFTGTTNLGDGSVPSLGGRDLYVLKYSANGVFQWKRTGRGAGDQVPQSICVDTAGDVHLGGYFLNTMDTGAGTLISAGDRDMFVLEYSSSGTLLSAYSYGDAGYQVLTSITTDASDNLYVFGIFAGTINFGVGTMTSVGNANLALAKFNSVGQCQWSKRFGLGSALDSGFMVTDSFNNLYIAGNYLCCLDFGGGFVFENGGGYDIYLAKFDPSGANIWTRDFGDADIDFIRNLAIDANDNVYLSGVYRGTIDFGGGPLHEYTGTFQTIFLAELDQFGNHVSSQRYKADYFEPYGLSVATHAVFLCGGGGPPDLGGGLLPFVGGPSDAYLARYTDLPINPLITSITDMPGDEGKQVLVHFARSAYDADGNTTIVRYELFRKRDDLAERVAPRLAPDQPVALPGWVYTGAVTPSGQEQYVGTAPTLIDSTIAQGSHFSTFFVRAATANPLVFFDSVPDSGYSLDNLAPPAPSNFAYQGGQLGWDPSSATDFDYFSVYGSNTSSFASATLVDYTTSSTMNVTSSPYAFYFVTATDFSGNEGAFASLTTPTAVGGTPGHFTLSISAYPNPFNPQTTIRYTVPVKGRVMIDLFDARGSRVVTLFDGVRGAGAFSLTWNGENDNGRRMTSGVYFARVTQAAQTRTYKLVLLK